MNIRCLLLPIIAACALAGCQNPYQKFYQSTVPATIVVGYLPAQTPRLAPMGGDAKQAINQMWEQGYSLIGVSHFNGPSADQSKALAQAHDVGAEVVLINSKYQNTVSGSIPITTPTAQTSFTNGTASAYGTGGYATGTYTGTTTTYGTQTSYVPYSVDHYDQAALFFAPLVRTGFGVLVVPPSDLQKQAAGTNQIVVIEAVRRGSPAFTADILPGDEILSIGGQKVYDIPSMRAALERGKTAPVEVRLIRNGSPLVKTVLAPDVW